MLEVFILLCVSCGFDMRAHIKLIFMGHLSSLGGKSEREREKRGGREGKKIYTKGYIWLYIYNINYNKDKYDISYFH